MFRALLLKDVERVGRWTLEHFYSTFCQVPSDDRNYIQRTFNTSPRKPVFMVVVQAIPKR